MLHAGENIEEKKVLSHFPSDREHERTQVLLQWRGGGLPITDFTNSQNTSHREACRSNLPQSNITQNLSDFSKQKVLHKIGIAQKGHFTKRVLHKIGISQLHVEGWPVLTVQLLLERWWIIAGRCLEIWSKCQN